jgi:mRNA-degrading endonuclease YafQ of YafQ-DinJ toxin-antitoxin module
MELIFSKTFERAFKKFIRKYPNEKNKIQNVIRQISENYLDKSIGAHKLSG